MTSIRLDRVALPRRQQVVDGQKLVEPELRCQDEARVREDQVVEAEDEVERLTSLFRSAQRPADNVARERKPLVMPGRKRLRHRVDVVPGPLELTLDDPPAVGYGNGAETRNRDPSNLCQRLEPATLRYDCGQAGDNEGACQGDSHSPRGKGCGSGHSENDQHRKPGKAQNPCPDCVRT